MSASKAGLNGLMRTRAIELAPFNVNVAHMVEFLISDKANNITGQNFIVDGGQSILGEENHIKDMK